MNSQDKIQKSKNVFFELHVQSNITLTLHWSRAGRSLQKVLESFADIFYIRVTSLQHILNILINNMLTWLIISKKSKPLLLTAAVAQMSQKQNASAMQGRGRPSLCTGTWRSQPARAHPCLMG